MPTLEERNKAVVLRLKDEISSQGKFEVSGEIMAPGFRPKRQGMHNLIQNASGEGYPEPGSQMRAAFPDRVDHIEFIMAEGDRVGMAWRQTGTHLGNLCGIAPTGRKIDVAAAGYFRVENGLIVEGDNVWMQFRLTGTHQGSFYGYPPTGRRVEMLQVGVVKVVDGKIAEAWYLGDELGLLLQTDALSALSGNAP